MNDQRHRCLAASAVLLIASSCAIAATVVVSRVLTRDNFSYAVAFFGSADGCESGALEIFASKSMTRTNNYAQFDPIVRAQIFSYNYCTNTLMFMSGADTSPLLYTKPDLTRSTARSTVVMTDFVSSRTVDIDLVWSGGTISGDRTRTVFTSPRSRTMVISSGAVRQSDSIGGSLLLDGVNLLDSSQMPSVSVSGFVTSSKGSSIDIIRD